MKTTEITKHDREIHLSTAAEEKASAIAIGWFQSSSEQKETKTTHAETRSKRKDLSQLKDRLKESGHFHGKKNEASLLRYFALSNYPNTMLIGMGSEKKWTTDTARQAGAQLFLTQKKEHLESVAIDSDSFLAFAKGGQQKYALQAFAEGYLLAGYEYTDLKKKEDKAPRSYRATVLGLKGKEFEVALGRARQIAAAMNFARSLGDRPGNVLTPSEFAELCTKMSRARNMKCTVLDGKAIQKEKMGLFWGVAKGSVEDPKFIIMEYWGGKKSDKPIALVGKGITFDSGGISLKPAGRMEEMKYDMMGAATVAGVMQAISDLKLKVNVIGYIGTTENMPGGKAQKPGDVQRSLTGKTVEIVNTDAEGRLVLADVIEYAQKEHAPQAMMDFATLTGAVVNALGSVTTGVMGNHPGFMKRLKEVSDYTGERVWELPLYEEYEEDLKSSSADYRNSGIAEAGASKAGTFLKFFVDPKLPWIHCDIAGSAYHRKDLNYHPAKYGAGVMIRLVTELLENWTPLK